jgi:hypothetical protein
MNLKNFEYLRNQIKDLGFGDTYNDRLKDNLLKQQQKFTMDDFPKVGESIAVVQMRFGKSSKSDMYFFNDYKVTMSRKTSPFMVEQTFPVVKSNTYTLDEALKLINDRAIYREFVNKEGELYKAWAQIDFSQKDQWGNYEVKRLHAGYGFDLKKAILENPILSQGTILELQSPRESEALFKALEAGERPPVTVQKDDMKTQYYIQANARFREVIVYDRHHVRQRVELPKKQSQEQTETEAKDNKKSIREEEKQSETPGSRRELGRSHKRGKSVA